MWVFHLVLHIMASGQAEVVLREVSKYVLSTGNVYDSALPWLTGPEMCAFMVIVITAFLHIMASGQAEK